MPDAPVAFVDTEATGLDPDLHEIWEVAAIVDGVEYEWFLPVDLGRADPVALRIGHFHERYPRADAEEIFERGGFVKWGSPTRLGRFAADFADLTRGRHLVGAVISFDEERLRRLLRANGACPEWHYHLVEVETLAVGYLAGAKPWLQGGAGQTPQVAGPPDLPWDSETLSRAVGVDPDRFARHTALGDARWAKAIYEMVMT